MTDDRTASFLQDLATIAQDPRIRAYALRRAGNPDLAEDALQDAFCAVALVKHPERIENLEAYFRRAMIDKVYRLRAQVPGAVGDAEDVAALSAHRKLLMLPPPAEAISDDFESRVLGLLRAEELLTRLMKERHKLAASVPARSENHRRYQASIAAAAVQIVRMLMEGAVTSGDWTAIIRSEYPEWYDDQDELRSIRRLRSAREDTRTLLKMLVRLDDAPGHAPALRPVRSPQAPLYLAGPRDEHVGDPDDAVITALFVKAEQILLPEEVPYDLDRGLQVFTAWLRIVR